MKKSVMQLWLLAIVLLCFNVEVKAQLIPSYTFSQQTFGNTYVPLTSPSVLATGAGIDNQVYPLTLPFTFNFDNTDYTNIYVAANGYVSFGSTNPGSSYWMLQSATTGFRVASVMDMDLSSSIVNNSEISYKVTGIAPNRVYIVQWKDLAAGGSNDILSVNFQLQLSESTNLIEMVYGNCVHGGTNSSVAVQVGLRGLNNTVYTNRSNSSSLWTNTSAGTISSAHIQYQSGSNPPSGLKYTFTPPPACALPAQPTNLNLTAGLTSVSINYTAPSPAPSKYLIVQTPGFQALNTLPVNTTTYTSGNTIGNGTVVYAGPLTTATAGGLTQQTNYTYTVFPYNEGVCTGGPKYNTFSFLSGTIQTAGPKAYTWVPMNNNADWTIATNWSPARALPLNNDTLIFNNGGTDTVYNIPSSQSLDGLYVSNNSNITFYGGYLNVSKYWNISAGSTLNLDSFSSLTGLASGLIAGMLNVNYGGFSVAYAQTLVTGTLRVGYSGNVTVATPSALSFDQGGIYLHARDGGNIPNAGYNVNSTVRVTGMIGTQPTILSSAPALQNFGNFEWNCSGQTAEASLNSKVESIKGNFSVINTNSYSLSIGQPANLFTPLTVLGDFIQESGTLALTSQHQLIVSGNAILNGGTLSLQGLSGYGNPTVHFYHNVTQQPGHFITATVSGSNARSRILFDGNTIQNINIQGTINGPVIDYTLNNPAGAVLTGFIPVSSINNIFNGKWSGSGAFSYSGGTLVYKSNVQLFPGAVEWPATNGPSNLMTNVTSIPPTNQLHIPGDRIIPGALTQTAGVIVLDDHNLTFGTIGGNSGIDSTNFIKADSTGYLIATIATNSSSTNPSYYYFWIGSIKNGTFIYSPVSLQVLSNSTVRKIGARVTPQKHPNDPSNTNYFNRYWSFIDDGTTAFNYKAIFYYPGGEVTGNQSMTLNQWRNNQWTPVSSFIGSSDGVFAFTSMANPASLRMSDYQASVITPLNGSDFTGKTSIYNTYIWNGSVSKDYQVPANWTPARQTVASTDRLVFNNNQADTVKNIPAETISRLTVTNYTTAILQSAVNTSTYTSFYTILSDNDSTTSEFQIDNGSALYSNGTLNPLRITFGNTGSTAKIDGRLEFVNTTWDNNIDFNNCAGEVTANGVYAAGTTNGTTSILTPANLTINGTFEHKYTTCCSSYYVPDCNWSAASVIKILGITSGTYLGFTLKPVGKVIYNCPNQTSMLDWGGRIPNVRDSLIIISTGTGSVLFSSGLGYNADINHYYQSDGKVTLSQDNFNTSENIKIHGSFTQAGGTFKSLGYDNNFTYLEFDGTNGTQQVNFFNAAPAGQITYKISNPNGIHLTGSGTLTGVFNINSGGGVHINTASPNPINTSLSLVYNNTNTTLTYTGTGDMSADTVAYPQQNSPMNVTVNTAPVSVLTVPFDRTIKGVLKMNGGDIDMGTHQLTLGSSVTAPGTLTYTSGFIRTTTGNFTRWFNTAALPTAVGTGAGYFPLGYNNSNRGVALYFSTTTALLNGGTIAASHLNATGNTTGLSVADGATTVNDRTNSSWSFSTGNGMALASGTIAMQLTAGDLLATVNTPANLRIIQANSIVGQHQNGAGTYPNYIANRTNLTLANLNAAPLYIGAATGNIATVWTSVTNGVWSNGSTWDKGVPPIAGASVVISDNTTVTTDANSNVAKTVEIHAGGTLSSATGTLTISDLLNNSGSLLINAGTINLGPVGGGNATFSNKNYFNISTGTLNVNGNIANESTSTFIQTGGDINIDGNAGGVAAASVPAAVSILTFLSSNINLQAGNITIVDPQLGTAGVGVGGGVTGVTGVVAANRNHNFIFGNGISTDNGYAFNLNLQNSTTGSLKLGNIIVNGSPSGTGRTVKLMQPAAFAGDLTVNNANGIFDMNSQVLTTEGNITVNANAFMISIGRINFVKNATGPNATPQLVSGSGSIKESLTDYRNFNYIYINNNVGGVVMDIGDIAVEYVIDLTMGSLNIGTANTLTFGGNLQNASANTGWIIGKLKRLFTNTSSLTAGILFPIGEVNKYTPILVAGTFNAATNGYIKVSTTNTDHPQIASSPFAVNKTVNRYFTMESGNLTLVPNSLSITVNWKATDLDPNTNQLAFQPALYANNMWTLIPNYTAGTNAMTLNTQTNIANGDYAFGTTAGAPVINTQPQPQYLCTNGSASFTISTTFANTYKWQVNTGSGWNDLTESALVNGSNTASLYLYNITTAMNGYQYRCKTYNANDSTFSNLALLNVGVAISPTLTIAADQPNPVCASNILTFTATPINGGTIPYYQWKINGNDIAGANGATFVNSAYVLTGDTISCSVNYNTSCFNGAALSNKVVVSIATPATPTVSIAGTPGNVICAGTPVSFAATTTNAGTNPVYQWIKNGVNVGTNSPNYSAAVLSNGDAVYCTLSSSLSCVTSNIVNSPAVTMTVNPMLTPSVTIVANGGLTVCSGFTTTFNATVTNGGTSPLTYQWKKNGLNVGTNSSTYSDATLLNNDIISCGLTVTPAANSCYAATSASSNPLSMAVNPSTLPVVSIVATPGNVICTGQSVTLIATVTNGSTTPVYQWKKNGVNVGSNQATYTNAVLLNGDIITCTVSYNTGCFLPATSNSITMTVNPLSAPTISIYTPQTTVCAGSSVLFTAVAVNGGNAPVYQWKKNNLNVGTNSSSYSDPTVVNGDVITCVLSTNNPCASTTVANSNVINMTVNPVVTPTISISTPQTTVCSGTFVTFSAAVTNAGTSATYQWMKNGINVGTNSTTYTATSLVSGDIITCTLTGNASCATVNTVTSNAINMTVNPVLTPTVTVTPDQTIICDGTLVTYTVTITNGGIAPVYQWLKNGLNVGSGTTTYSDASIATGDVISCVVTVNLPCATATTLISNYVSVTVNPLVIPQVTVSGNNQLCQNNTAVTLNANSVNGGTAPAYQWKKNGLNVGTNSNVYNDPAIATGDAIICELASNAACASANTVSSVPLVFTVHPTSVVNITGSVCQGSNYIFGSQTLTIAGNYTEVFPSAAGCDSTVHLALSVTPVVTPTISITANPGNMVSGGQQVTFTANITGGGTNPTIIWKKNNATIAGATGLTWQGVAGVDFTNGNVIQALLSSMAACASPGTVLSTGITMSMTGTGINEFSKPDYIDVFPNPTTGYIVVKGLKTDGQVEVYDILGHKVISKNFHAGAILNLSLEHIAAGTYTLVFINEDGRQWHIKVVRQ